MELNVKALIRISFWGFTAVFHWLWLIPLNLHQSKKEQMQAKSP